MKIKATVTDHAFVTGAAFGGPEIYAAVGLDL